MKKKKTKNQALEDGRKFISDADFNSELKHEVEMAKRYFQTHEVNGFIPQLRIIGLKNANDKRPETVIILEGYDPVIKMEILMSAGEQFYKENPHVAIAVFLVSEAWVSNMSIENEKLPSQNPDKQEILVISGLTIDGRANVATLKMNRLGKNNIIAIGDSSINEYQETSDGSAEAILLKYFYLGYLEGALKNISDDKTIN